MRLLAGGWSRACSSGRWVAERIKDLLYGPGNTHLDIGRLIALWAILALLTAAGWNMWLKQPIDLGPSGLGGGLAGVLTAAVIYIYKDRQGGGGA